MCAVPSSSRGIGSTRGLIAWCGSSLIVAGSSSSARKSRAVARPAGSRGAALAQEGCAECGFSCLACHGTPLSARERQALACARGCVRARVLVLPCGARQRLPMADYHLRRWRRRRVRQRCRHPQSPSSWAPVAAHQSRSQLRTKVCVNAIYAACAGGRVSRAGTVRGLVAHGVCGLWRTCVTRISAPNLWGWWSRPQPESKRRHRCRQDWKGT